MSTRKKLGRAWTDVETVACALEGKAPEMSDKEAMKVVAKALWLALDWIVRRIDDERRNENG